MNITWIKYFVILCETKSFRLASEKIGISSPALSKAIFELEEYFKATLINRKNKFDSLTPAGEFFFRISKELVNEIDSIENKFKEFVEGEPYGVISIASEGLAQNYVLPFIIPKILEKHPKIYLKIYSMISDFTEKNVLEGKINFGILSKEPVSSQINSIKLGNVKHSIIGKKQDKKHWSDFNYIVPRFFGIENDIFVDGWNDNKYKRNIIMEVEGLETTIKYCEQGIGVAFLPELCVREKIDRGILSIVSDPPFEYNDNLFLIWANNIRKNLAFLKIIEEIKENISFLSL